MNLLRYLRILRDEEIARRYFVMNSFDGALTILGIVIAMYIAGKHDASLVIISSLGAAVAMTVSGIWGAYAAERAERTRSLRELEKHLLADLNETEVEKKAGVLTILIALVNSLSPLMVSLIIISPFFTSQLGLMGVETAFYFSFMLILLILFLVGMFVARIGAEDALRGGLKMVLAGIVVGVIIYGCVTPSQETLVFSSYSNTRINPYNESSLGIWDVTWLGESTLVVKAYVSINCAQSMVGGDYEIRDDNSLLLGYRVSGEPVADCNGVHELIYRFTDLAEGDYMFELEREASP